MGLSGAAPSFQIDPLTWNAVIFNTTIRLLLVRLQAKLWNSNL